MAAGTSENNDMKSTVSEIRSICGNDFFKKEERKYKVIGTN